MNIKKILISVLVATTIMSSMAISAFATIVELRSAGVSNMFNGSYYYDQAWAVVNASGGGKAGVQVGVIKNGNIYGLNETLVTSGNTRTCYSGQVQGSGGNEAYVYIYQR